MTILDLSHTVAPAMTVYPGTDPPGIEQTATHDRDGFAEKRLSISSHTGTHVDAPGHILAGAKTLDQFPVDRFIGPGFVADVSHVHSKIPVGELRKYEDHIRSSEFLLLHTGWDQRWKSEEYFRGFPILSAEAAAWLAGIGLKGIGIDAISVDPVGSSELPVHRVLLARDMLIIENLTGIAQLAGKEFLFCCMPLKIERADGSPVRAVALVADHVSEL